MLVKTNKTKDGERYTTGYKEVVDEEVKDDSKTIIRYNIEKEIYDIPDAVADNAKMISLLVSLTSRMYDVLDDTAKDKLDSKDREMIESMFGYFNNIETLADKQLKDKGGDMITSLLDRQQKIADIVYKYKETK